MSSPAPVETGQAPALDGSLELETDFSRASVLVLIFVSMMIFIYTVRALHD